MYIYIHIFATTYAKIHATCSLLDTSLNLISKSKWRKNLLSGKKMWLSVCWSHSPPTCRRVKSRPRKHLHSCMGGHVGVSTLDIKSGESIEQKIDHNASVCIHFLEIASVHAWRQSFHTSFAPENLMTWPKLFVEILHFALKWILNLDPSTKNILPVR